MGRPCCSAFDPGTGLLCIAGKGSGPKAEPYVSLWRLDGLAAPDLLASRGQPARQPLFGGLREPAGSWLAAVDVAACQLVITAPGQPLCLLTWQVRAQQSTWRYLVCRFIKQIC